MTLIFIFLLFEDVARDGLLQIMAVDRTKYNPMLFAADTPELTDNTFAIENLK